MLKSSKKFIGYISVLILIYFIYENIEFLDLFKTLNFIEISFIVLLLTFRIYINSLQNLYLYKFINISLSKSESINLFLKSNIANSLAFMNLGGGYKALFLKKKFKLKFRNYLFLNTIFSGYKTLIYLFLFFLFLVLNNKINNNLYLLFFLLPLVIYLILTLINPKKLNFWLLEIKKYKILFLKLNINLFLLFFLIKFILFKYFQLFDLSKLYIYIIVFFLVGFISVLINVTPGNIGFKEAVLIFTSGLHNVPQIEILTISLFSRFLEITILLLFSILFDKFKKN